LGLASPNTISLFDEAEGDAFAACECRERERPLKPAPPPKWCPPGQREKSVPGQRAGGDEPWDSAAGLADAQFRLTIRDPKTNAVLWAFAEHVQWAVLQGNRDKNFEEGRARIVCGVQALAAP
jgi:hypothetical protein